LLEQQSYYAFKTKYAITKRIHVGARSVEIVVGYRNLGELSDKLKPFSYRILKDDCLDLPEKTFMKRIVRLTDEQEKVYKQMKQLALAELNGKLVTTASVLTQLMRLHQITSGHFVANDGTTQILKNERLDELINVLNEIEGKAIIWAHYRYDIQVIVEALKKEFGEKSVVTYYGDTSQDDRQKAIRDIQDKDSPVRFLVGTPQTGGYGITLTGANTMIYYSNGYDLEKRQQSEARIDRIGQTRHMTYIDIICENTVDEKIVEALRKKVNIASKVMGEELKDWI
jgi:SNF2 family DNA or RNA helicase